ncbi:bifunctional glutamate N-acetyltransferase/amino-acid acetyltransferase ArgJ [Ruminococcus sp.]|uniref:bifunctional glutamate N-acetyltransferase/amino-acid acetyltransferase ArgJ n=1 Tax=Ruminococcus sp. TaxID=41978 RepID=UPI002BB3F819|nr:bifunctional glutamate N-acetyltransferase/amino-acid acetyltransferase ArgJ [Ruminococcus sp.]HNZ99346.1 bifunctional glutamate N-acetyltransferase/amino-acid acetyltransferase ArgJ [Ruminococcus sp.]HOH86296.1 bifunctional glutamate N-acetyltransferase/amino-acid acetyltransferase ArgJ [Ruminococcus sp.]
MKLVEVKGITFVEGGVCAAKGFKANGVQCGLAHKPLNDMEGANAAANNALPTAKKKNDLALIVADKMCSTAAVYTTNKVKGAPILVTKEHIKDGKAKAVIVNSVNANTCNPDGVEKATKMCQLAAKALGIDENDVIVASTGVIGQVLPIEPIANAMDDLAGGLTYDGNKRALEAIMTTDTREKEIAVQFELGGKICTMGGMLKGSGMIHPNMATTLTFLTTDADISPEMIQLALSDIVKVTLNRASVDGDTSTNDMVCIMASGEAGNKPVTAEDGEYEKFRHALYAIMMNLARMMARDGEGATKLIECAVRGAETDEIAETVAKSVITSSLIKAMIFGEDANAGRIFCALGYADADFDISKVDVEMASEGGVIPLGRKGCVIEFSEEIAKRILKEEEIKILISLGDGKGKAITWGCDLTYDYVKINGDYRS